MGETHKVFGQRLQKTQRTGKAVGSNFISLMEGLGAGHSKMRAGWWGETGYEGRGVSSKRL